MALANVALTDTFDTWRTRTNQLVVVNNGLLEGSHLTTGTITSTNTGTAINVSAGSIKVKNNVFSSNAIAFISNSSTLTISGTGRLGTTVYFDVGTLSTSIADRSTANIASANTVNLVNDYAVGIYGVTNSKIGSVTSNSSSRLWANNTTDGTNKLVFLDLATSGVTATTYGGATQIPYFDVDAYGRITSAANVTVQGMDYPFANNVGVSANAFTVVAFNQANAAFLRANASSILIGNSTPTGQTAGTLWWNNDYGRLFIYYNDGDTNQWVETSPQSGQGTFAFDKANSANILASNAFDKANAANVLAFNAFANASGTLNGSLTVSGSVTSTGVIRDSKGDLRDNPPNDRTVSMPYSLIISDAGKTVIGANVSSTQNTIFIPANVFSPGNTVYVYNNSAAVLTLTQNSGVTMYLSGTATTGNRNIAQRGFAQVYCVFTNNFVVSGTGVT